MPTVKVSPKTYEKLNKLAGALRARTGRPVSVDEALNIMIREGKLEPSDFEGTFSSSDEETDAIFGGLDGFWSKWKPRKGSS